MKMFLRWIIIIILIIITSHFAFSQQLMRDNLGSHIATKDLNLSGFNINAALNITATGTVTSPVVLAGTATTVSNSSIALQVDGTNKAILVPRVTDLLNATTPSIPLANAVNGMIVYNVATAKFYYRQNNAWVVYVDAVNYVDRFVPQVILGLKTMKSDSGFVASGTFVGAATTVPTPIVGAGTRMMWYPAKSAFRAGTVPAAQWDLANVGIYSTAFGNSNIASGSASFASGFNNLASGANTFVSGNGNQATGTESFASGNGTVASGAQSIAGGTGSTSSGTASVAIGASCTSTGLQSVAMGFDAHATNTVAMAFGSSVTADAPYSMAFGANVTTKAQAGSMVFGDTNGVGASNNLTSHDANQISMRFAGGYRFFTSPTTEVGSGTLTGVQMAGGANAWSTISDKRKKTNFETANAESFLVKIDTMQLGSWNYKGQDVKTFRHYGPMAQDFYGAFGKDSFGTVGCDTLINSADIDGVNMIAIKGLVKRTSLLSQENDVLKALEAKNTVDISALRDKNEKLSEKLLEQESNNLKMQEALAKLQKLMENIVAFTPQQSKEAEE